MCELEKCGVMSWVEHIIAIQTCEPRGLTPETEVSSDKHLDSSSDIKLHTPHWHIYILRYMLQVVWRKLTKSPPLNQINVQQLEPIFSELTHFTMKYNRISQNLFMFHLPGVL